MPACVQPRKELPQKYLIRIQGQEVAATPHHQRLIGCMQGDVSAEGFDAQAEFQDAKVNGSGTNYKYSLRARKTSGDGGLIIRFAKNDGGGSYLAWFLGVKHRNSTLEVWGGGGATDVAAHALESSFAGTITKCAAAISERELSNS